MAGDLLITNGQAMAVAGILCRNSLIKLRLKMAGNHGPASDQEIHDEMCNKYCLANDRLRETAMQFSGCSCLDLSTAKDDLTYTAKGDWCLSNSGQILCDELERCGTWRCAIDDFHCRRREYNKQEVLLKGYGDQCNASFGLDMSPLHIIVFFVTVFVVFL